MAAQDFWYEGAHSVTFTDVSSGVSKNTWTDWHLIPSSPPIVTPPGISTNFVEIPGGFSINTGRYLTGSPVESACSGSWEFIIANGFDSWDTVRQNVTNFIHGKRLNAVLADDINTVLSGRFSVSGIASEEMYTTLTINYAINPYW